MVSSLSTPKERPHLMLPSGNFELVLHTVGAAKKLEQERSKHSAKDKLVTLATDTHCQSGEITFAGVL